MKVIIELDNIEQMDLCIKCLKDLVKADIAQCAYSNNKESIYVHKTKSGYKVIHNSECHDNQAKTKGL